MSSGSSRRLSWHEKRAAEAAFRNSPFDPAWGKAAHRVYVGIQSAQGNNPVITGPLLDRPQSPRSHVPHVDSSHALVCVVLLEPLEQRYLIFPVQMSVARILLTIKRQFPQRYFELERVIPMKGRRRNDTGHSR